MEEEKPDPSVDLVHSQGLSSQRDQRIKEWIKHNRHLPGKQFFQGMNSRLRGHYNYYGVKGNSMSLKRFYDEAIGSAFKWLNRRGGKRQSLDWKRFTQVLDRENIARPRITEVSRRRVYA
jgi:hypothetical protein